MEFLQLRRSAEPRRAAGTGDSSSCLTLRKSCRNSMVCCKMLRCSPCYLSTTPHVICDDNGVNSSDDRRQRTFALAGLYSVSIRLTISSFFLQHNNLVLPYATSSVALISSSSVCSSFRYVGSCNEGGAHGVRCLCLPYAWDCPDCAVFLSQPTSPSAKHSFLSILNRRHT
jgi:hypothetical protein